MIKQIQQKLTNKESFTIITGPTGTTTNGGKKVNRHKISLCAPGGGMIERFLDQYTDTASGKLIPWTNKRIGGSSIYKYMEM